MNKILLPAAVTAALFAASAHAGLSTMNATCPGNLEVHVDQGGPVYINGKEAKLKRSNDNYYEATDAASGVVVSISNNPDGSSDVSYTGKNRANGVCQIAKEGSASASEATPAMTREMHPAAEKACLAAVAKTVNIPVARLSVIEALGAQAGVLVTVKVPDADAPWTCNTDEQGRHPKASYGGSEGKL